MAELIPTASEAEWLEARRKGVTASEIAVIMGLSPWDSPYALYHRKAGILPPMEDNAAMERGRVLEPYIRGKFAEAHPEYQVLGYGRSLFRHAGRQWQMATPDATLHGLNASGFFDLEEPAAVAEFKTASSMEDWGEPGTDEIPVHYRCQVLWQMDVMGVGKAHVAVLDIPRWRVLEYVVGHGGRDPWEDSNHGEGCSACGDQYMMRAEGETFLKRLENGDPPDVDWRPATAAALKELHPSLEDTTAGIGPQLADRYEAACRNYKHWEQRKKLYEAQIREQAGPARRVVRLGPAQVPVARRDVYEVRESLRKGYTVDKIVATPPKPGFAREWIKSQTEKES